MKAILKTIMAGPQGSHYPGDTIEDLDGSLVAGGFADPVEEPKGEEPIEEKQSAEEVQQSNDEIGAEPQTDGNTEEGSIEPVIEQAAESADVQGKTKKAR